MFCFTEQIWKTFLLENWREVDEEIGKDLNNGFAKVLGSTLSTMFKKVPLEELFLDVSHT